MPPRRHLFLGLPALLLATAAAAAKPHRRRLAAHPTPSRSSTAAAAPAPRRTALPEIDPVPTRSASGLEPAPVPASNVVRPLGDRQARTDLDFGVPTPRQAQQGASFGPADSVPDPAANSGGRVPSLGATLRAPF